MKCVLNKRRNIRHHRRLMQHTVNVNMPFSQAPGKQSSPFVQHYNGFCIFPSCQNVKLMFANVFVLNKVFNSVLNTLPFIQSMDFRRESFQYGMSEIYIINESDQQEKNNAEKLTNIHARETIITKLSWYHFCIECKIA